MQSVCPHPRRQPGSCFKCHSKDFPARNVVGMASEEQRTVDEDAQLSHTLTQKISVLQLVRVLLPKNDFGRVYYLKFNFCSLFDTGSPVSFVRTTRD